MTHRDQQRLADIQAAIEAIRDHLQRGDLSVGLIFDAVYPYSSAPSRR